MAPERAMSVQSMKSAPRLRKPIMYIFKRKDADDNDVYTNRRASLAMVNSPPNTSRAGEDVYGSSMVELERVDGSDLGLVLAGGLDKEDRLRIVDIQPGGIAHRSDRLLIGDYILAINDVSTLKLKQIEIMNLINSSREKMTLQIQYKLSPSALKRSENATTTKQAQLDLEKDGGSFGIVLRGGARLDLKSCAVFVVNIRPGSAAHRESSVHVGDRLLFLNGQAVTENHVDEIYEALEKENIVTLGVEYDVPQIDCSECSKGPCLLELNKMPGVDMGLNLTSVYKNGRHYIGVDYVRPASLADRSGVISPGDILLSINAMSLEHTTPSEALQLLTYNNRRQVKLQLCKSDRASALSPASNVRRTISAANLSQTQEESATDIEPSPMMPRTQPNYRSLPHNYHRPMNGPRTVQIQGDRIAESSDDQQSPKLEELPTRQQKDELQQSQLQQQQHQQQQQQLAQQQQQLQQQLAVVQSQNFQLQQQMSLSQTLTRDRLPVSRTANADLPTPVQTPSQTPQHNGIYQEATFVSQSQTTTNNPLKTHYEGRTGESSHRSYDPLNDSDFSSMTGTVPRITSRQAYGLNPPGSHRLRRRGSLEDIADAGHYEQLGSVSSFSSTCSSAGVVCHSETMDVALTTAQPGCFGIHAQRQYTSSRRKTEKSTLRNSIVIGQIEPNSPADVCIHLQENDRILSINGHSMHNRGAEAANQLLHEAGNTVHLRVEFDVTDAFTLLAGSFTVKLRNTGGHLGLAVVCLSTPDSPKVGHIFITDIRKGSVSYRCGNLQVGDEVLAVNGVVPENGADFVRAVEQSGEIVVVKIQRHDLPNQLFVVTYGVQFEPGNLPVGIGLSRTDNPFYPFIISVLEQRGLAGKSGAVHVGDFLISVNDRELYGVSLESAQEQLDVPTDPLLLRMCRIISNGGDPANLPRLGREVVFVTIGATASGADEATTRDGTGDRTSGAKDTGGSATRRRTPSTTPSSSPKQQQKKSHSLENEIQNFPSPERELHQSLLVEKSQSD